MKYIVEDGFSKIHKTGIGQYTLMIEFFLKELSLEVIKIEKSFLSKLKNKILRRILYNFWLNTIFLVKLISINDNITVFCTNYAIPILKIPKVKFIPVIHDLCVIKHPECDSKINNFYQTLNIKNAIRNSEKIITVSNTIRNEISKTFAISKEKIFVVNSSMTSGLNEARDIDFEIVKKKYNIKSQNYILSVATLNKRKNLSMLIDAYEKLKTNIKLVLVGGSSNAFYKYNNKNIIFTGYIKDEELKILYKNAKLYVSPSIYEGFGTPLIDAQSFGVPVLCSNIPVFKEVCGESANYFSIEKNDLTTKLHNLLNNKEEMNNLINLGAINITRFSKTLILKSFIDVIENRG